MSNVDNSDGDEVVDIVIEPYSNMLYKSKTLQDKKEVDDTIAAIKVDPNQTLIKAEKVPIQHIHTIGK